MNIKEAVERIDDDALFVLCEFYDAEHGEYPEHPFEGAAVYSFLKEKKMTDEEKEEAKKFMRIDIVFNWLGEVSCGKCNITGEKALELIDKLERLE